MTQYFSISNWQEFQHYKDRNPPWIKLHNQLLDNYQFECLTDATKGHLLCIWMLASRTNNKIVYDQSWVKRKIGANSSVDLESLLSSGFIELQGVAQDASKALVSEEESRDREEKRRIEQIPYREILDIYHETLPNHPKVRIYSDGKKRKVKGLYNYNAKHKNLDWWKSYFERVGQSAFLTGQVPPRGDRKIWIANFEWLMNKENFAKIVDGIYHE